MALSHHECKCRNSSGCFVPMNFIPPEFKLTKLAWKNMPEPVWYDDQTFWYLHYHHDQHDGPDLEIFWRFLRGHDIFRKTSHFLVFFHLYGNIWVIRLSKFCVFIAFVLSSNLSICLKLQEIFAPKAWHIISCWFLLPLFIRSHNHLGLCDIQ